MSTVSAELAIRALTDPAYAATIVAEVGAARGELAEALAGLGFRVAPSLTNFLLCRVGPQAAAVAEALMGEGLVVRAYRAGALTDHLRFKDPS